MPRSTASPAGAPRLNVLIVDDEKNIRSTLVACLESVGCRAVEAANSAAARSAVERAVFDLVLLDLRIGEENGLELLPWLVARSPSTDVVIITAFATVSTAVDAMHKGARDYLPKPFTPAQIRHLVDRVARQRELEREVVALRLQVDHGAPEVDFSSEAASMRQIFDLLAKAAAHDVPVLLRGENGTGKSVLARRLHQLSDRCERPFVVVNCPTLSEELLASELFGHAKGAFTGAVRDQPGRVEAAEGGTLFLDEVAELPPALQAKLLRFVQDHEFERLGESLTRYADVRIVAATNRDLDVEVQAGRFREDLMYRLNTFEVLVPPLRERREDIVPLARRFVASFGGKKTRAGDGAPRPPLELTPEAETALSRYEWPGNVRELRNAVERAVIITSGVRIGPEALPERIAGAKREVACVGGDFTIDEVEREHIARVLDRTSTLEEGARILGIDTSTLWRKRKKLDEA